MIDEDSHVHEEEIDILEYLSLMASHRHYCYCCDHGSQVLKGYYTNDIALLELTLSFSIKYSRINSYRMIDETWRTLHFLTFEIIDLYKHSYYIKITVTLT